VPVTQLAMIAMRAPEYMVLDYLRLLRGMSRGGGPMHEGGIMAGCDFFSRIPAVAVPVYFFSGANDYNTPLALVREYYETIDAPQKALVVFERSAHVPFLAETDKFAAEVIRSRASSRQPAPRPDHESGFRAAHHRQRPGDLELDHGVLERLADELELGISRAGEAEARRDDRAAIGRFRADG
jgi:hypothetical protein